MRDNYCKIYRFIEKIENSKTLLRRYLKCAKKSAMRLPAQCDVEFPKFRGRDTAWNFPEALK